MAMFSVLLFGTVASGAILQPSGQWNVDFAETQCAAARDYGEGKGATTLALRQSPFNDVTHLFLFRAGKSDQIADQLPADLRIGAGAREETYLLRYGAPAKSGPRIVHRLSLSPEQMSRLATATRVEVKSGGLEVAFGLRQMDGIAKLLDECTRDLRTYWNMGESSSVVAVPPQPVKDVRTLYTAADYPADAQQLRLEGTVQVMLLIDETGKTRSCEVIKREGAPVFEAMACQVLIERARFTPAKDIRGKALRSTYMSPTIRFVLG